mgnify:CR=1 FL=1
MERDAIRSVKPDAFVTTNLMGTFKGLDYFKWAKEMDVRLIPYELAQGMAETKALLSEIRPGQSIGIFIGPEEDLRKKKSKRLLTREFLPLLWENGF